MDVRRAFRTLTALVAVMLVISAALMPALHVHIVSDAEGHPHAVVHQHWAPHRWLSTHGASLDDEETATDLDRSATVTSPFTHIVPIAVEAITPSVDESRRIARRRTDSDGRPQGPPLTPSTLRAPPRTA